MRDVICNEAVLFRPYCGGVVTRTRNASEYMLVLALCLVTNINCPLPQQIRNVHWKFLNSYLKTSFLRRTTSRQQVTGKLTTTGKYTRSRQQVNGNGKTTGTLRGTGLMEFAQYRPSPTDLVG